VLDTGLGILVIEKFVKLIWPSTNAGNLPLIDASANGNVADADRLLFISR
jgi:hypothetical protein